VIPRINIIVSNDEDESLETLPIDFAQGLPRSRKRQCCLMFKMGYDFFEKGHTPVATFLISSVRMKVRLVKKKALIVAGLTIDGVGSMAIAGLNKAHNHFKIDKFSYCPQKNLLLTFFYIGFRSAKNDQLAQYN
jgi:hypothetical protein